MQLHAFIQQLLLTEMNFTLEETGNLYQFPWGKKAPNNTHPREVKKKEN